MAKKRRSAFRRAAWINICGGELKYKVCMLKARFCCLGAASLNMKSFVIWLQNLNNCRLIVKPLEGEGDLTFNGNHSLFFAFQSCFWWISNEEYFSFLQFLFLPGLAPTYWMPYYESRTLFVCGKPFTLTWESSRLWEGTEALEVTSAFSAHTAQYELRKPLFS